MVDRVLIGKNINSNLGYSSSSPGYGLWVSEDGVEVLSATEAQLLYRTDIADSTSGVTSRNGEIIGAVYTGYTTVTTDNQGNAANFLIKAWPESVFTFNSTVYAPLVLTQMGKTAGAATTQYSTGYHTGSGTNMINGGMFTWVHPKNRTSSGQYSSSGTYGATLGYTSGLTAYTTYRVYYAICYPVV